MGQCEGGGTVSNRKERRGNKDFKNGGKLGQGVGALKWGDWNPLKNYDMIVKILLNGSP